MSRAINPRAMALRWAGHAVECARENEEIALRVEADAGDDSVEFWARQAGYDWARAVRWLLRAAELPGEL